MATLTEYVVFDVDENGDALHLDFHPTLVSAQKAFNGADGVATVLEKRSTKPWKWQSIRKYQVMSVKGDSSALESGGWHVQDKLEEA